jgi:hypothetical protein
LLFSGVALEVAMMFASSSSVDRRHKAARGEVEIRFPAHGMLHTWVAGHMDTSVADFIRTAGNEVISRHGRLLAFHEWADAETYDSAARKLLTDWGTEITADVVKVHILFRSKLAAMGVSVASVVLGGMIAPYQDAQKFQRALQEAVRERHQRGSAC